MKNSNSNHTQNILFENKNSITLLKSRTPIRTSIDLGLTLILIIASMLYVYWRYVYQNTSFDIYLVFLWMLIGAMIAHLSELQHELLHSHAFKSMRVNRVLGFLCGIPSLSSYSAYRHSHLLHHRLLGTPNNTEFFKYRSEGYDGVVKLFLACINPERFYTRILIMLRLVIDEGLDEIKSVKHRKYAKQEYLAYLAILIMAIFISIYIEEPKAFILCWLAPALLIGEAVHFLVELPEHLGLPAHSDKNVLANTRTINATAFSQWFTNGNNLHTAHHMMASIPMRNCSKFNKLIASYLVEVESSYFQFLKKVVTGKITPSLDSYVNENNKPVDLTKRNLA